MQPPGPPHGVANAVALEQAGEVGPYIYRNACQVLPSVPETSLAGAHENERPATLEVRTQGDGSA